MTRSLIDDALLPLITPFEVITPAKKHLSDHFNNAGAANPGNSCPRNRRFKSLVGRPKVTAYDLVFRVQCFCVDSHPFNRTGCGSLAAGDLGAFKSRTCRTGGRHHPVAIAQYDFSIRTDINQQSHFLTRMGVFRQYHAGRVGAGRVRRCRVI